MESHNKQHKTDQKSSGERGTKDNHSAMEDQSHAGNSRRSGKKQPVVFEEQHFLHREEAARRKRSAQRKRAASSGDVHDATTAQDGVRKQRKGSLSGADASLHESQKMSTSSEVSALLDPHSAHANSDGQHDYDHQEDTELGDDEWDDIEGDQKMSATGAISLIRPEGQLALNPKMSDDEAILAAKREYNRRNAARARKRNRTLVNDLQQTVYQLAQDISKLKQDNSKLRQEKETLSDANGALVRAQQSTGPTNHNQNTVAMKQPPNHENVGGVAAPAPQQHEQPAPLLQNMNQSFQDILNSSSAQERHAPQATMGYDFFSAPNNMTFNPQAFLSGLPPQPQQHVPGNYNQSAASLSSSNPSLQMAMAQNNSLIPGTGMGPLNFNAFHMQQQQQQQQPQQEVQNSALQQQQQQHANFGALIDFMTQLQQQQQQQQQPPQYPPQGPSNK